MSDWTMSFFGSLASDFTLRGSWAYVPWGNDEGVGELAYELDFDEVQGEEVVTLTRTDKTGGFLDPLLVRPERSADVEVRFQDSGVCPHVVTETGEVYELVAMPPGWSFGEPASLHGPGGEVIRPSDVLDISGEVARGNGFCGPGLLILGDRFDTD